jgi:hypothetical protein
MSTAVLKSKTSVKAKKINLADYPRIVLINEVLPFRVRFTSIGVEGYSSTNPPPIPLQVIGYSNYIL